jgi:predicted permease
MFWSGWRRDADQQLEDEFRDHIGCLTADYIRAGMSPEDARRRALAEFGGTDLAKEECRDLRPARALIQIGRDLSYGWRMLRKSPGFTAVAVLSLSLGIAANTTIFSAIDALMLRPLPARNPDQLVAFRIDDRFHPNPHYVTDYKLFERYRTLTGFFSDVALVTPANRAGLNFDGGAAIQTRVALVSGNYFPMLGVDAALGRYLTPDDNRVLGAHPVAVISYRLWQREILGTSSITGHKLTLLGVPYSIIGVMPRGFSGSEAGKPVDVWVPMWMAPQAFPDRPWQRFAGNAIGRLKPGASRLQAEAAVKVMYRQSRIESLGARATPQAIQALDVDSRVSLEPAAPGYSSQRTLFRHPLAILTAVVALVLLIACMNVANLLLARSEARRREIAMRLAIGAGAGRIVCQLLTESLLLAAIAGGIGLALARWGTAALAAMVRSGPVGFNITSISLDLDTQMDWRILAFTIAVCVLNGILFGLAPAFRGSRVSLAPSLMARGADARSGGRFGLGKSLVVGQIAATLVLAVAASLFVRSLRNLRTENLGLDRDRVLQVWTAPGQAGRTGPRLIPLFERTQQRLSALPGVLAASPSVYGLLSGGNGFIGAEVHVQGFQAPPGDDPHCELDIVMPHYFDAAGMRLLAGRDFSAGDTETAPRVVIINETIARHFFPGQNPIGRRIGFGSGASGAEMEIVGVVSSAKHSSPREGDRMVEFTPYRQDTSHLLQMTVLVRTAGPPASFFNRVRDELRTVDPNLPIVKIETIDEQIDDVLVPERLIASLAGWLGAVAVILACLGVYGVMSYKMALRTNEIGIRFALGATRASVISLVLRECLWLVGLGILIGTPLMLGGSRLMGSILFGIPAWDPLTIAAAALLLLAVAAMAGYLPARRVSRIDPVVALRQD